MLLTMSFSYGLIGIFITTQVLVNDASSQGLAKKPNFRVTDYDFVNTNTKKVCLLALVDASIRLKRGTLTDSPFEMRIPSDSSTEGSYCNRNFKSVLTLKFADNVVKITFGRSHIETPRRQKIAYYCTDCNYGQWSVEEMAFTIRHNGTEFHAATNSQNMKDSFPPVLAGGITLRRSFLCHSSDALMKIPLSVNKVTNVTNGQHMNVEDWTAEIDFTTMQFQPFLVGIPPKNRESTFSDPVLCKDVTASHVVVILLPLVYFAVLIACYYIKTKYGCPIWRKKMKPGKDNEDRQKFITSNCSTSNDAYKEIRS